MPHSIEEMALVKAAAVRSCEIHGVLPHEIIPLPSHYERDIRSPLMLERWKVEAYEMLTLAKRLAAMQQFGVAP